MSPVVLSLLALLAAASRAGLAVVPDANVVNSGQAEVVARDVGLRDGTGRGALGIGG